MLLCDFHIHTSYSDGMLPLPKVVDLFGQSGHDVIAITDHIVNRDNGQIEVKTDAGILRAPGGAQFLTGEKVHVGFRPEAVLIGEGAANQLHTTIAHVSYLGEIEQYGLELAPGRLIKAFEQNPLEIRKVGEALTVHVRPQDVMVLPE